MKLIRRARKIMAWAALLLVFLNAAHAADPVITEFMASNHVTLADEDGDYSDWIEIYNPNATPLNLDGWYLTDNAKKKTKWQFPAVTIQPDSYRIVFASDKDRRDPGGQLHTNFSLAAEGEYLGLIKPDGVTVVSEFAPKFPPQPADLSYGLSSATDTENSQIGYFGTPTPGARNGDATTLILPERVSFSRDPGTFTGTVTVQLSGATTDEKIRYVVADPSASGAAVPEPTADSAEYTEAITISSSSIVRAAVFSADDSRHGLASTVQYVQLAVDGDQRLDGFSSQLPILVLDDHGFGPMVKDGIDRPAWLHVFAVGADGVAKPANATDLSLPVSMQVRGFSSSGFPKKSFNITLQTDLGRDNPQALLGLDQAADWALVGPWYYDPSFIHNAYVYALSNRIGRWAPRTQFAELFFNTNGDALDASDYQGITVLTDRIKVGKDRVDIASLAPSDITEPAITGGYVIKIDDQDSDHYSWTTDHNQPETGGSFVVVDSPKADKLVPAQRTYIHDYVQQMENALYADRDTGWTTHTYLNYIDLPSWVDHHLLEVFVGNTDAFQRSDYFFKDRGGKIVSGPAWDFDRSLGSADGRDEHWDTWQTAGMADVWNISWWGVIARDPEFMQAWIDRWQSLRRTEFSSQNLAGLADSLAAQVGPDAAARDAARWADDTSRYPGGFSGEISHVKDWITNRANWIDQQFVAPPALTTDGAQITITAPDGLQLAYVLDGTDPRVTGGGLAPGALLVASPLIIDVNTSITVRCYNPNFTGFPGTPWSSALAGTSAIKVAANTDNNTSNIISGSDAPASRLAALSSRSVVGAGDDMLIAGVAVNSSTPKRFLIRGVGPALGALGVPNSLEAPLLRIIASDGTEVASNSGWGDGPDAAQLPQISASAGAAPLPAGSRDAALIANLPNGAYSIQVSSGNGQPGVGLAEIFELDENGKATALSARGIVYPGDGILIGGLVVRGSAPKRLLIRGIGPSLAAFGVGGTLNDPILTLYQGSTIIGGNDDWGSAANAAEVPAASAASGTFTLTDSKDAALLITLDPGVYTVQLSGKGNDQGVGLLEIYEAPAK